MKSVTPPSGDLKLTSARTRSQALFDGIKALALDIGPGNQLPKVTDLCEGMGVSPSTLNKVLDLLEAEKLIVRRHGVGIFSCASPPSKRVRYLFLADGSDYRRDVRLGFEDQIANLGDSMMTYPLEDALSEIVPSYVTQAAGIFVFSEDPHLLARWFAVDNPLKQIRPRVGFSLGSPGALAYDAVALDNVQGGRAATNYLLSLGHTRIGFVGFHPTSLDPLNRPSRKKGEFIPYLWSQQRAYGWKNALELSGNFAPWMQFCPEESPPEVAHQRQTARETVARNIESCLRLSALVVANDEATRGFCEAFEGAQIPLADWPSLVSFDGEVQNVGSMLTSMHLPWYDVGREAANLLHQRRTHQLQGEPIQRQVRMRLIPRLTCNSEWGSFLEETEKNFPTLGAAVTASTS